MTSPHPHLNPSQSLSILRHIVDEWENNADGNMAEQMVDEFRQLDRHLCSGGALPGDWTPSILASITYPKKSPSVIDFKAQPMGGTNPTHFQIEQVDGGGHFKVHYYNLEGVYLYTHYDQAPFGWDIGDVSSAPRGVALLLQQPGDTVPQPGNPGHMPQGFPGV